MMRTISAIAAFMAVIGPAAAHPGHDHAGLIGGAGHLGFGVLALVLGLAVLAAGLYVRRRARDK